jgi:hypothetical protein
MNNSSFNMGSSFATLLTLLLLAIQPVHAQELNANVTIDRSQISSTSLNYLDNLAQELETYINEYNWIDANFQEQERIGMDLQITLLAVDNNYNFEAQVVIRSRRPIFNTPQETALFLFNDESWNFNYTPNRALMHDKLQYDGLTSLIDFYAYIILGYDFDSFSALGGTPYYSEAQNIVSLAQTTSSPGWSRGSNRRNRAQLVADLLNTNFRVFRRAIYQYHRQGLDAFLNDPQKGRQQVLQALQKIQEAKRNTSSNLLFDIFFNAKYREIVSIFEDADAQVRLEAYNLLSQIDQSHLTEYRKLQ